MNITFEELRALKHSLPTGSIKRIANDLAMDEQTVRNYFGAKKFQNGTSVDFHRQPGPGGGIVHLEDVTIYNKAKSILREKVHQQLSN